MCPKQVRITLAETVLSENVNSIKVYNSTDFVIVFSTKIWKFVPVELKQSETLYYFKLKIKNWVPTEGPCRLCKTYIQQVGFL